jgi:hypothetical protein
MVDVWTSRVVAIPLTAAAARKLCARGLRRGGATATFARRAAFAARLVVWAPGAGGDTRPIGTVGIQWRAAGAGDAVLAELSWPATGKEDDLWHAVEELAGAPITR